MAMNPTDMSEAGLEALIVSDLCSLSGYVEGSSSDFDREHAIDLPKLLGFIEATQPEEYARLGIAQEGPVRRRCR